MSHLSDQIDDYMDGELAEAERAAVERHLSGCAACRADVEALRSLVADARALPRELEPGRDLWPAIAGQVEIGQGRTPWVLAGAVAGTMGLLAAACLGVIGVQVLQGADAGLLAAEARLADGDLPAASEAYAEVLVRRPQQPDALEGEAYLAFLAGDYTRADELLAQLPEAPDVRLRRATVALRRGDLDAVKAHGLASQAPAGLVLAAEVHLADAEVDAARTLLTRASDDPGVVGDTARQYLACLDRPEAAWHAFAEVTALWALGERGVAAEAAADVVPALPEGADRDQWLLVWAGRAVTSGHAGVAADLLDRIAAPPPGQAWRVHATRAMVLAASGETDDAVAIFEVLESGGAPSDGIADARATAAALVDDPVAAVQIAGPRRSVAAARGLMEAGATYAATIPDDAAFARYAADR